MSTPTDYFTEAPSNVRSLVDMAKNLATDTHKGVIDPTSATATARALGVANQAVKNEMQARLLNHRLGVGLIEGKSDAEKAKLASE